MKKGWNKNEDSNLNTEHPIAVLPKQVNYE